MRLATILLAGVAVVACARHAETPATATTATTTSEDKYAGFWRTLDGEHEVTITREGAGYIWSDEDQKNVAYMHDGILQVSMADRLVPVLYAPSTDHIIAAGREYQRAEPPPPGTPTQAMLHAIWRRTMADMRSIATAWEARATDVNTYLIGTSGGEVPPSTLQSALAPTYIKVLPTQDGFGHPFRFDVADNGQTYEIRSLGRNGQRDAATPAGELDDPDLDVVYSNGTFVSYPRNMAKP